MSRPYAEVIGDPIAQSKSPLIHNFWLEKLGIDAEYRACHVRPDELADYFAQRRKDANWRGCNVTIPHKVAAMAFADSIEGNAKTVGATNCIVRTDRKLVALNTDVDGVLAAVPNTDAPICMIGAGGAARSVMPILDMGVSAYEMRVVARDPEKAARSLDAENHYRIQFFGFDDAEAAMESAEGVINASPLGMIGQPPMPEAILRGLERVNPSAWVFDMVYAPLETELLRKAAQSGHETVDGLVMLVGQAGVAFEKFFGQPAPREHDAQLRALLTA